MVVDFQAGIHQENRQGNGPGNQGRLDHIVAGLGRIVVDIVKGRPVDADPGYQGEEAGNVEHGDWRPEAAGEELGQNGNADASN